VVIALIVAAVAAIALHEDDQPLASTPVTGSAPGTTARPGATTTTVAPNATGALQAAVDEAIAFVEKTRGKKFKTKPPVDVLADAAFVARLGQLIDEDYADHQAEYEAATVTLQAFGVLKKGASLIDTERAFGSAGVLGFYDPETNELVVRAGNVTPYAKIVMVHELTHALDDQYFELFRPQYDDSKDEISFAFTAVAEGDARRVENAYRASLSNADRASATREEASYSSGFPRNTFTSSYLLLQVAPYQYGEAFVEDLVSSGGEAAVDQAFVSPPETSEKIVDFRKFQAKEGARQVAVPPADGAVVDDGVVGQVAIEAILSPVIGASSARDAAAGWGGDWYVAWRDGSVPCARANAVMDTQKDLDELRAGLDKWVKSRTGATLSVNGSVLTLTTCAR
jgi:hypothetical protein